MLSTKPRDVSTWPVRKADALQKALDNLTKELEMKDQQIAQLKAELEAKDIHIRELDQRVTELNTDVTNLTEENTQHQQTITNQDMELNTAYFVFGTKKELKNQGILDGGGLFKKAKVSSSYNNEYFTKIEQGRYQDVTPRWQLFARQGRQRPAGAAHHQPQAVLEQQQVLSDCC